MCVCACAELEVYALSYSVNNYLTNPQVFFLIFPLSSFALSLSFYFLLLFPLWVSETCSVFHYQWKKWGEWFKKKKVLPISINTHILVENESKILKKDFRVLQKATVYLPVTPF